MSAGELERFEVFVNTHTSSVEVEAADADEAAELGSELLRELLADDARRDNLSVTPIATPTRLVSRDNAAHSRAAR